MQTSHSLKQSTILLTLLKYLWADLKSKQHSRLKERRSKNVERTPGVIGLWRMTVGMVKRRFLTSVGCFSDIEYAILHQGEPLKHQNPSLRNQIRTRNTLPPVFCLSSKRSSDDDSEGNGNEDCSDSSRISLADSAGSFKEHAVPRELADADWSFVKLADRGATRKLGRRKCCKLCGRQRRRSGRHSKCTVIGSSGDKTFSIIWISDVSLSWVYSHPGLQARLKG